METISRRQSFSEKGINVMSEKEKIIVFSSREICYQSSSFFANQMADAFEDLGFDVQVCEFDEHDDLDAVFQPLYGQKYRLLLDFNSTITRMVEEDGTPVLDKLDGPFFDYILDHPLFHYNCLNADLKNLNGIFLDEAQGICKTILSESKENTYHAAWGYGGSDRRQKDGDRHRSFHGNV